MSRSISDEHIEKCILHYQRSIEKSQDDPAERSQVRNEITKFVTTKINPDSTI